MKKITLLILFNLILFSPLFAQTSEEKEVTTSAEALRKAMIDADKSALENLIADEVSYGHSGGKVDDKTSFLESVLTAKNDYKTITISEQTIRMAGKDLAIIRNKFNAEILTAGEIHKPDLSVLQVWQKQKGSWRLLARQGFVVPPPAK